MNIDLDYYDEYEDMTTEAMLGLLIPNWKERVSWHHTLYQIKALDTRLPA